MYIAGLYLVLNINIHKDVLYLVVTSVHITFSYHLQFTATCQSHKAFLSFYTHPVYDILTGNARESIGDLLYSKYMSFHYITALATETLLTSWNSFRKERSYSPRHLHSIRSSIILCRMLVTASALTRSSKLSLRLKGQMVAPQKSVQKF